MWQDTNANAETEAEMKQEVKQEVVGNCWKTFKMLQPTHFGTFWLAATIVNN